MERYTWTVHCGMLGGSEETLVSCCLLIWEGGDLPDHSGKARALLSACQPHKNEEYPVLGLPSGQG